MHDPAAQFASPYSYGGGNPVNGTDPTGAWFLIPVLFAAFTFIQVGSKTGDRKAALIAGAIAGVTAGVASYYSKGIGQLADAVLTKTEQQGHRACRGCVWDVRKRPAGTSWLGSNPGASDRGPRGIPGSR